MNCLAITTGDLDGVGLEVSAKALNKIGPQGDVLFFFLRGLSANKKILSLIDKKFNRITFTHFDEALDFVKKYSKKPNKKLCTDLIDLASDQSPPYWVESVASACHKKTLSGLATGPLSKELIASLGWPDRGHTEILKRVTGVKSIHQAFIGKYFNVLLTTAHIPLKDVSAALSIDSLNAVLLAAKKLQPFLSKQQQKKPIAVLGINPHAGENGLLGEEERALLSPFCKSHNLVGPLSPDAAFLEKNWCNYSVFIACYHDQGLIPFKTIHGQDSGVHVSMGLPFPRTSVDHGTAKDIFGKNKANANSMIEAIELALRMIKKRGPYA
ncbi:MAG: 4-hydroxythreonine-4-phosphate dehydrogenase PdxA [Bdellovibrionota bacterium]